MIKVLGKVDHILRQVAARGGISFGELVRQLGIHKATLSNILRTLTQLGYVRRDESGACFIGPTVLCLASHECRRAALPGIAKECARTLAEELRETVTIGQLIDGDRFNLAKATVEQAVSVNANMELRPSPYDTATGRALLAFCSGDELAAVVARHGLPGSQWDGVDSEDALRQRLAHIRSCGMAEVVLEDARSFALPVHDADGVLVASVGVGVPAYRLTEEHLARVHRALAAAVARMQRALRLAGEV